MILTPALSRNIQFVARTISDSTITQVDFGIDEGHQNSACIVAPDSRLRFASDATNHEDDQIEDMIRN